MSLKLYFAPGACSFVPHALLEAAGAAFEPVLVKLHKGEHQTDAYKTLNPRMQVPVLVDDSETITQIMAIVMHLDHRFPDLQILPAQGLARTRVLEKLAWMNNTVHPTFTHVFMPFKFASTQESQADVKALAARTYEGQLAEIDAMVSRAGQGWLGGGAHFGPLDVYALTLLRWGGFAGIDPTRFGSLWAHVQRVAAVPAVARAIERERLQLNVYKPG